MFVKGLSLSESGRKLRALKIHPLLRSPLYFNRLPLNRKNFVIKYFWSCFHALLKYNFKYNSAGTKKYNQMKTKRSIG